jgi:hypothetical protein
MALVIDGTGDITGLVTGALESTAIGTGAIRQVVEGVTTSETFTYSTSYVATNLTATITPTSSTSRILVLFNSTVYAQNSGYACHGTIYRDGSDIGSSYSVGAIFWGEGSTGWVKSCSTILDSPASTSALTYVFRIKTSNATYQAGANRNTSRNSIVLVEIA